MCELRLFVNNILQIDMTALRQMGDKDLKELGIPMVFPFPSPCTIAQLLLKYICGMQT